MTSPHLNPTEVAFQMPGSGCDKWTFMAQGLTTQQVELVIISATVNDTAGCGLEKPGAGAGVLGVGGPWQSLG